MNADKVIMKKVNTQGRFQTFKGLGKGIGETGQTSQGHSDSKILPFHQRSGNVPFIRVSSDGDNVDRDDTGRRITALALRNILGV